MSRRNDCLPPQPSQQLRPGILRRELLRIGGVSILSAPFANVTAAEPPLRADTSGRSCIFIMLQGGPSHHDLWDPKPDASAEIRGPFESIATSLPGVRFGELAVKTAAVAQHIAVIRSMTHKFTNHIAGTYITMTGSTNQPDRDREAHADDFPGPGALMNYLRQGSPGIPASVSLPNWLSIPGPSNRMPGQYGGFLGAVNNPFLIKGDPSAEDFRPLSLTLPEGMNSRRLSGRLSLVQQLDELARQLEIDSAVVQQNERLRDSAYQLVTDGRVREALDLSRESDQVRDAYGRDKLGQSLLLARRLVEAGVRWVSYNEFNQKWDTHGGLEGRYRQIVPPVDQAFASLIRDLHERQRLSDTMVACGGEFGRTPKVNNNAGRDHWTNAYSFLLAGGGVQGGQVLGASDAQGAEVVNRPVAPADVLATIWRQLGLSPQTKVYDRLQRPFPISGGQPIAELL